MVMNRILGNKKPDYELVISQETADMVAQYLKDIQRGKATPGVNLEKRLAKKNIQKMTKQEFLLLLIQTKAPVSFAEMAGPVNSNLLESASNWNKREFDILSRVGTSVNVEMFDNGRWQANQAVTHPSPHSGSLIFVSGALLKSSATNNDVSEIVRDNEVNFEAYYQFYEQRLLPMLLQMNNAAKRSGDKLFVTVPGLGTGSFSGGRDLKQTLERVLEKLLTDHAAKLTEIKGVYYDSYDGTKPSQKTIGGIEFIIHPLTADGKPQLCKPEEYGAQFKNCKLVSFVAGDPLSIPGNEGASLARNTDDGVKGMATNVYQKLTGFVGKYNPAEKLFKPLRGNNWKEVMTSSKFRFGNNRVIVTKPDGGLVRFEKYRTNLEQVQDLLRKLEIYARAHKGKKGDFSKLNRGLAEAAIFQTKKILTKYPAGQTDIADEISIIRSIKEGKAGVPKGDLAKLINDLYSAVNTLSPVVNVVEEQKRENSLPPRPSRPAPQLPLRARVEPAPQNSSSDNRDLPPPNFGEPPLPPEPQPEPDLMDEGKEEANRLLEEAKQFIDQAKQLGNGELALDALNQKVVLYQKAQGKLEDAKKVFVVDPVLQTAINNAIDNMKNELRILVSDNNLALGRAQQVEQKRQQEASLEEKQKHYEANVKIPADELAEIKTNLNAKNKTINDGIDTLKEKAGKLHHPAMQELRGDLLKLVSILNDTHKSTAAKSNAVARFLGFYGDTASGGGISNFYELSKEQQYAYKDSVGILRDMSAAYGYFAKVNARLKDNPEQAQELRQAIVEDVKARSQQNADARPRVSSSNSAFFNHGSGSPEVPEVKSDVRPPSPGRK